MSTHGTKNNGSMSSKKYLGTSEFIDKYKIPHVQINHPAVVSKTHGVPFEYDDWYSENEEHLLDIWHGITNIIEDRGLYMLDRCGFNHLCTFVASRTTFECSDYPENVEINTNY